MVGYQRRRDSRQNAKQRTESLAAKLDRRYELSCSEEAKILAVEGWAKGCVATVEKPVEGLATETVP